MVELEGIIIKIKSKNQGIFTFMDYLNVLKEMNFISKSSFTKKEEELVTKSWHLISFYQSFNIITSAENVETFLAGIIGVTDQNMFSKAAAQVS